MCFAPRLFLNLNPKHTRNRDTQCNGRKHKTITIKSLLINKLIFLVFAAAAAAGGVAEVAKKKTIGIIGQHGVNKANVYHDCWTRDRYGSYQIWLTMFLLFVFVFFIHVKVS